MHVCDCARVHNMEDAVMSTDEYTGPRIGDRVQLEVRGTVAEMQARGGVASVLVIMDGGGAVWFPLERVVLLARRGEAAL